MCGYDRQQVFRRSGRSARAQYDQIQDLEEGSGIRWIGVGREDGKQAGEFISIFYRKERLEPLEHDTFWLSEQPDVPAVNHGIPPSPHRDRVKFR